MQTSAASFFSAAKLKILIILLFVLFLGFIVFKMMQFEDSIREKRIVRINVGGEKKKLLPEISYAELQIKSENSKFRFKTGKKFFSIQNNKIKDGENISEWKSHFLKGVNMGVALPGNYPSEFSATYEQYLDWFKKIAAMNSNTVRIYTILPPEFYEAFAQYNIENSNKPLYLMQGVWADEADSNNYLEKSYSEKFQKEIKDVIDVIHGNAIIQERPGHAAGTYARDISHFVVSILLGREWEPVTVTTTNKKNPGSKNFTGNFISLPAGTPMECWLAQMMDFTVQYETQIYEEQRPLSFVNWLPVDPMYHNSEFIENKKVREYDNDIESIDFKKFFCTNLFKAGMYSAYHAYPYYPDFIYLDDKYKSKTGAAGEKDNYLEYLEDLKNHCPDMPLIIAEYGLPSSRGNSHYTPYGLSQGGHSEEEQALHNKNLTQDIFDSGCGGAIYFEWMDEWFKFNWLVIDFEIPADRRKLWHNMENPEQNFGLYAIEQRTKTVDGNSNDWSEKEKISEEGEYNLSAGSDAEYFYLKYKLDKFDFTQNNLYAGIDTYDKAKGDHKLPFLPEPVERGLEFLITVSNKDSASILVDEAYSVYSDIYNDYVPGYTSKENYSGKFVRQILLSNRERESLLGEKTGRIVYDRSGLIYGNSNEPEFSNSNWNWNESDKTLEIRIPWHLLNVSDPSSRNVLDDKEDTRDIESSETDGFYIYSYITDKNDRNVKQIPEDKPGFFKWDKWEKPDYTSRLKKSYYVLQDLFGSMHATEDSLYVINNQFQVCKWYNDKEGAITISLDDASMTQYEYGLPVLEKYGLNATFALVSDWTQENPSPSSEKGNFAIDKFGWKQARELLYKGNEIASHNLYHVKMDTMSDGEVLRQMLESRIAIEKNLNTDIHTFVFPYSSTRQGIFELAKDAGYLFARTGEENINESDNINLERLSTHAIYSEDTPSLNELNDYIINSKGKWLILNYHNIFPNDSKEMNLMRYHNVKATYSVTPEMFDKQVRLIRNSNYWIAPINVVGRYIDERLNSKLEITDHGDKIFINAVNLLDTGIYNIPLTIKFITGWSVLKITNSANDGIYNPRNNEVYINLYPNKEVIVEKLND
ncbi:MAG: polysaccharide deacetylase family protein [bacterium]|nr:polysaccharide deacetylase family protein [bacterium]